VIEYSETGALFAYRDRVAGGRGAPLSRAALRVVAAAFDASATLV
jgi:hypothetical protein